MTRVSLITHYYDTWIDIVRALASLIIIALLVITVTPAKAAYASPSGLWVSPKKIGALPTTGPAWDRVKEVADSGFDAPGLTAQNRHNVQVLAAALVAARLDDDRYRARVRDELRKVMMAPVNDDEVLAAARRLGTYVIAADLIDLRGFDAQFDATFRTWIRNAVRHRYASHGGSIIQVHEQFPNNFGTHAGASRVAVAAYLGDTGELARAATVFRGWLGDRAAHTGFNFSGAMSWHCDPANPVGVNPAGCIKNGHSIDGVLPDDQRRGGEFAWPPRCENYVWGALQGAVVEAELLARQGYPAWQWQDQALRRAVTWLHDQASCPASDDEEWVPWLVNHAYGSRFPASTPAGLGKNMAFTDWTHSS